MNKTVKKVLSIGIFFGIVVFGLQSTQAVDRYDCSRFDDRLGECRLSSKCEVDTGFLLKNGQVVGMAYDKAVYKNGDFVLQADETKATKKYCKLQDDRINDANIAHAQSECEKVKLELEGADSNVHLGQMNLCKNTAKNAAIDCVSVFPISRGTAATRRLNRKFELACRKERQQILENAEKSFVTEDAEEYAPFGVYDGPSFGGPGLKAGSELQNQN